MLIRALARPCGRPSDAIAVRIGDGPEGERLQELIAELGLRDRNFMVGPVFAERELAPFLPSSRVLLMPTAGGLVIRRR